MSNKVFEELIKEKVDIFIQSFKSTSRTIFWDENTKTLIHPGEYGMYRENICKDFIKYFIPARLQIGQGFVINTNNEVSSQCDLVLFDKFSTPLLENEEKQRFFPVETVCAIGEVKSVLSKSNFKEAINKLAKIKRLREFIDNPTFIKRESKLGNAPYNPIDIPYDHLFSFIICERLDFNIENIANEINELYEPEIDYYQRHNLILSIEDGILLYYDTNNVSLMYPKIGVNLKNRFVKPNSNNYTPFKFFTSYLFMGTESCTILYPDISNYAGSIEGGLNYNEK
jgi:hypothetical protein